MANKVLVFGFSLFVFVLVNVLPSHATNVEEIESNGVKAWIIKDNFLPIVSIQVAFRNAGYAYDPEGKEGVANFVAGMLNEGAGKYSANDFQQALEENAIYFSPSADAEYFTLSIKTLTENLDLALDLTNSALSAPSFGRVETERVRGQILTYIRKAKESPDYVVQRKFAETYFGNHPYSKPGEGTAQTVAALTSAELTGYTRNSFAKDNIVISIVGDVDENTAIKIINSLVAGLPEKAETAGIPEFNDYPSGKIESVELKNPQTYISFAIKGIERLDKDYYAALVLSHILGGNGFQSRLVDEVREKNGLAYSIGTVLSSRPKANLLVGQLATKTESVDKAIEIIREEYRKLAETGVTEDELNNAKSYLTGSFGLNLDANEKLSSFLLSMQLQGLDKDFLNKRNEYVESVTLEQINDLSKRLISADSLVFVKAGM